ncbi:MAG TPA: transketolase C-terminal domain-containing protein [Baekduia sp.]
MSDAVSYRDALGRALREALAEDERVVVLGQDVGARGGAYGVTAGLLEAFGPTRVRDAPSADAALVGIGVGAALAGLRPVVELTTAAFLPLAFDQVVHQVAAGGAPVVLRVPQSAGARLGPIHSANVEGLLHAIPGLRVLAPSTPGDAYGMLRWAIGAEEPVVVLEHIKVYDMVGELGPVAPVERAVVRRAGTDVTLIAASRMAVLAERAAETLATRHGFEATVVDLRSLRPLDVETVRTAARGANGRAVIVEEGWPRGGVGATLAAELGGRVVRLSGADAFVPYARTLEAAALPDEAAIVRAALPLARVRDRRAIGAPHHSMAIEIDMEALVARRRAGDRTIGELVATLCADLLTPFGETAILTTDGPVVLIGDNRRTSARQPAATLAFGVLTTRPTVAAGAVTIHHTVALTLTLASGLATTEDATTLLAAVRERLETAAE